MSEFASTAMMRVMSQGMQQLGLELPPLVAELTQTRKPTMELDADHREAKTAGARGCCRRAAMPRAAGSRTRVRHFAHEPTYRAMTTSSSPEGLFLRWHRLEKYIHSLRRTDLVHAGALHACVQHRANRTGASPSIAEDLVVSGVLAGLLEAMGVQGVAIDCGDVRIYPELNPRNLPLLASDGRSSRWTFTWTSIPEPAEEQAPSVPVDLFQPDHWSDIACRIGNALLADLVLVPDVPAMAKQLALSSRSLQRRLAECSLSYNQILTEARSRVAAWRLLENSASLAEVGYLSGYADQAHFTRNFKNCVGVTPARYRRDFGSIAQSGI